MDLGALDQTVRFERPLYARNGRNEKVAAGFELVCTVRARRTAVSDGERVAGAQVAREVSDRFVTHYSAALAALDLSAQLVCEGMTYSLVGRKELGRRAGFEWSAKARPQVGA